MGLFDYVKCELPLPIGQDSTYQTKDTDTQYMMHHTIRFDGRLVLHDYEFESTPQAEKPYPDAPEGSLRSLAGMIRPNESTRRDVDQNFDGDLEFYDDAEYRATFRNGTCTEISQFCNNAWVKVWPSPQADKSTSKESR